MPSITQLNIRDERDSESDEFTLLDDDSKYSKSYHVRHLIDEFDVSRIKKGIIRQDNHNDDSDWH